MHSFLPRASIWSTKGEDSFSSHHHILPGLDGYHEAQEERLVGRAVVRKAADRLAYHTTGCIRRWVRRAVEDIVGVVREVGDTVVAAVQAAGGTTADVQEAEGTIVDVQEAAGTVAAVGLEEEDIADGHPASSHYSLVGAALPQELRSSAGAALPVRHSLVEAR